MIYCKFLKIGYLNFNIKTAVSFISTSSPSHLLLYWGSWQTFLGSIQIEIELGVSSIQVQWDIFLWPDKLPCRVRLSLVALGRKVFWGDNTKTSVINWFVRVIKDELSVHVHKNLKFPETRRAHIFKKFDRNFPKFGNNPQNIHDIINNRL